MNTATTTTTSTGGWQTRWRRLRRLAREFGLHASMHVRSKEIVITICRNERTIVAVVAQHPGSSGVVRAATRRPIHRGDYDDDREEARLRAIDIALSELARLMAISIQWSGGVS